MKKLSSLQRKPNVVALKGNYHPSVITQRHLQELAAAQEAQWDATRKAALLAEDIAAAIAHGATVEAGPLTFDERRGMARSSKARGA